MILQYAALPIAHIIQTFFFLWVWSDHNHHAILSLYSAKQKIKTFPNTWPWPYCFTSTEARLPIRDGDGGGGGNGTREWRLDCGYCPKKTGESVDRRQNNGNVMVVSPRHSAVTSAPCNFCFNCHAGQSQCSHKDNVRCTAVEEQPKAKEVQLSQPSSTSLLMISSGLTWGSSSTSLLLISPWTLCLW